MARLGQLLLVALLAACVATPLPHPPTATADPELMTLEENLPTGVRFAGSPGSISPAGQEIRITIEDPAAAGFPGWQELTAEEGAFTLELPYCGRICYFFVEALLPDEDLFLIAVTGGPGTSVQPFEPADGDNDGSPDTVDCAPHDPTFGGRRCE
jgi:hypothetical protein